MAKSSYRAQKKLFDGREDVVRAVEDAVWGNLLWIELDRGVLPEEEVLEKIRERAAGYEKEIQLVIDRIGEVIERKETAIPWIRELKKKGHRVLFLSNYSDFLRRANPGALDFLPLMDGGVWSDEVKLLKPDPKIYLLLCERYGLKPEECIFIDDNEDNIKAAASVGLRTIHYTSYEEAHHKLIKET